MDARRKRLMYRAKHRGFREADLLVGAFADAHLAGFDADELDAFEHILEAPDQDLYAWIAGRAEPPANFDNKVMALMRAFRFADNNPDLTDAQ